MQLFCDKMHEMSSRGREMRREGVELRLLGNTKLLPDEVQRVIEEVRERARRERREEEEAKDGVVGNVGGGGTKSEEEQLDEGQAAEEEWIARQANQLRQRQQQHDNTTGTNDDNNYPAPSTSHPAAQAAALHTAASPSHPPTTSTTQPTAFVNLCVAYTSQQEMTDAAARIASALQQHQQQQQQQQPHNKHNHTPDTDPITLHPLDLSASLFHSSLYTASLPLPFPSLLLRTSGEHRLSDFLLCQLPTALLCWSDKYWPQLSFFDVLACVMVWQRWVRSGGGEGGVEVDGMEEERVVRDEWRSEWLRERGGRGGSTASEAEVDEWLRGSEERIERFVQTMPSTTVV